MARRARALGSVAASIVLAVVLTQVMPDLSDRLRVAAQQAYYFRQHLPHVTSDGTG